MPFITEEIWNHLPDREKPLIVSDWPTYKEEDENKEAERKMNFVMNAIKGIRNARQEMNIPPSKKAQLIFVTKDEDVKGLIDYGRRYFINLASADSIVIKDDKANLGDNNLSVVLDRCEVFIPLKDLIDFEKEIERLEKEKEKLEAEIKRAKGKLSNEGFVKKAPEHIVEKEREKLQKYESMLEKVLQRLESLKDSR